MEESQEARGERLTELAAEAQHARRRYALYKAKTLSSRATSPERLRELKQASELAETRLRRWKTSV